MLKVRNGCQKCGIEKSWVCNCTIFCWNGRSDYSVIWISRYQGCASQILNHRASGRHESDVPQPPLQELKIENGLSYKDLWAWLLSKGVNSTKIHGRSTKVLRKWPAETLLAWTEGGRENKIKGLLNIANSTGQKQAGKLLGFQYVLPFIKKEGWHRKCNQELRGQSQEPQRIIPMSRNITGI